MHIDIRFSIDILPSRRHHTPDQRVTTQSWARLRRTVKKRDHALCYYCGTEDQNGHVDHLVPLSIGGTDSIENLAWSCSRCNLRKGEQTAREFMDQMQEAKASLREPFADLPVSIKAFRCLASGILDESLTWSRASMSACEITGTQARALQSYLEDKQMISFPGTRNEGAVTTASGRKVLELLVSEKDSTEP